MTGPDTEKARRLMIQLEKNVCICDCLGCKTSSCLECSADKTPPWKRWDMCFEQDDNSMRDIIEMIRSVRQEENEKHEALIGVLVGALQGLIDPDECDNFDHHGYCQTHFGGKPCVNEVAKEAISHPLVQEYLKKSNLKSQDGEREGK